MKCATISNMKRLSGDTRGSAATVLSIALLAIGLVGMSVFAAWSFMGLRDYKINTDEKIAVAVQENTKKVQAADAITYAEESKNPLKTYIGPEAFGTVSIAYPKTWSVYVDAGNTSSPVDYYAHPDVVPSVDSEDSNFALRVQVVGQSFSAVMQQYQSFQKQGKLTVKPYALPKVSAVTGARLDGQLTQNKKGSIVIVPVRDKTLKIWTESDTYVKDFDQIILPNASFVR